MLYLLYVSDIVEGVVGTYDCVYLIYFKIYLSEVLLDVYNFVSKFSGFFFGYLEHLFGVVNPHYLISFFKELLRDVAASAPELEYVEGLFSLLQYEIFDI